MVACEVGTIGAEFLWGLRRKMRRVLAGCHTLIVGGANSGLMRADRGCWMVFDREDPELNIVVAAAEMVALDRHMERVAAHFEVDTVALGCESLLL